MVRLWFSALLGAVVLALPAHGAGKDASCLRRALETLTLAVDEISDGASDRFIEAARTLLRRRGVKFRSCLADGGHSCLMISKEGDAPLNQFALKVKRELGADLAYQPGERLEAAHGSFDPATGRIYVSHRLIRDLDLDPTTEHELLHALAEHFRKSGRVHSWDGYFSADSYAGLSGWSDSSYPDYQHLSEIPAHSLSLHRNAERLLRAEAPWETQDAFQGTIESARTLAEVSDQSARLAGNFRRWLGSKRFVEESLEIESIGPSTQSVKLELDSIVFEITLPKTSSRAKTRELLILELDRIRKTSQEIRREAEKLVRLEASTDAQLLDPRYREKLAERARGILSRFPEEELPSSSFVNFFKQGANEDHLKLVRLVSEADSAIEYERVVPARTIDFQRIGLLRRQPRTAPDQWIRVLREEFRKDPVLAGLSPERLEIFAKALREDSRIKPEAIALRFKSEEALARMGRPVHEKSSTFEEMARRYEIKGLRHQTSAANLLSILKSGQLVPGAGQGATAKGFDDVLFFEAIPREPRETLAGESVRIVVPNETLDRHPWLHATPSWDYGEPGPMSGYPDNSFEIFLFQVSHFNQEHNEVLFRGRMRLEELSDFKIEVPADRLDAILRKIKALKLKPINGIPWNVRVVAERPGS